LLWAVDGRVRFPSLRQFLEWGLNSLGGTGVQSESAGKGTAFAHAKHKFLLFHMPSPCKAGGVGGGTGMRFSQ